MSGLPSLEKLRSRAAGPAYQTQRIEIDQIDYSKPIIPEYYTQLYYTPIYRLLTHNQKLRYNQLFGVRTNEYTMMLERDLVEWILVPLSRHSAIKNQKGLADCFDQMIDEERRHYYFFLELNQYCLPDIFTGGCERYFSELPQVFRFLLVALKHSVRFFPFPLWYLLALEESSMALSKAMVKNPATGSLGDIEPNFLAVHREHLKDEARHVQIDRHLVDTCLTDKTGLHRKINARFVKWMLRMITYVGRSGPGVKVIKHLVSEMPELASLEEEMIRSVLLLNNDPGYQKSLFNRAAMPFSFSIFDSMSEFEDLQKYLVGYERP